ncbi:hypothetical protein GGF43_005139, partial [Coemansia sp. RSA 2618]
RAPKLSTGRWLKCTDQALDMGMAASSMLSGMAILWLASRLFARRFLTPRPR